jgi:hypothetical protein
MTASAYGWCGDALLAGRRDTLRGAHGGAPANTGLTVPRLVARAVELAELDGGSPTEEAVAEDLGLSVRWVRRVASRAGGWAAVTRLAAGGTGFGSGSRPPAVAAGDRRSAT